MAEGYSGELSIGHNCMFKEEVVNILGCICQTSNKAIIQTGCSKNNIITRIISPEQGVSCIKDELSNHCCSIVLLCSHYFDNISTELTGWNEGNPVIIVGEEKDVRELRSPEHVSVSLDEPDFMQVLTDMIYTKINHDIGFGLTKENECQNVCVHDELKDHREKREEFVPEITQKHENKSLVLTTSVAIDDNSSSDEDDYTKYNDRFHVDDQYSYQTLSLKPRAQLINLTTGKSGKGALVGVNVVGEYFHPSRLYWKEPSEIAEDINSGKGATLSELTRYVYTSVIPAAQDQSDLLTLSKLSMCDRHGVEDRVAKEIQKLVFTTEVNCHKLDILLECTEIHLSVVKKKAVSSKTSRTVLPNVILMLTLVYYKALDNNAEVKEMIARKLSNLQTILDNTKYVPNQTIERHLLNAAKLMIKGIRKTITQCKKSSYPLLLGCWREELMNENTVSNINNMVAKMSPPEHYSLVAKLFVQAHLGMEFPENLIDLIHTTVKTISKKTDIPQLYPLLVLVCRGTASLLNRHIQEDQLTMAMQRDTNIQLCEILSTCIGKIKKNGDSMKAMQDELTVLLFHPSSQVAKTIHSLISISTTDKIPAYLQTIVGPLGLTLCSEKREDCTKPLPRWQELKGYISGHKEVSINVLLPAKSTFDLKTYVKSATTDPSNGRHYNTLEILNILLENDQHPHIRRLIAFQYQPMPVFYMTERLPDATLSTYLLTKRSTHDWQPLKTLGSIAYTCVDVVQFLHERKIIHRNLIADSFKRRCQDGFVLADFSIASLVDDAVGSGTFIQDIDGKFIPTRWSAPESLLTDRYDTMSDTWMVGLLIHEIFTHGLHPFRDMFGTNLDDIMENVVFNNLTPRWYPCIPCPVHEIIVGCVKTKSDERLKLSQVQKRLDDWLRSPQSPNEEMPRLNYETFNKKNSEYPELDDLQGEPERGPTEQLKELKKMNRDPRVSYVNRSELRRLSQYPNRIQIKEELLKAADHPTIKKNGSSLEIREPVSESFITDTFPKMTSKPEFMLALTIASNPEKRPRCSTNPNGLTYTLVYKCQNASSLLEIAHIHQYGDPSDENSAPLYLQVLQSLAQFVNWMHERHWILRDICCSTTFRAVLDGRVFMPRLGRMIKDQRRISRIEACIIDKSICIDDRRNWMPAEVIAGGQFSQASDVYMMAMTMYEFYSTADLGKDNPMHNRLASVPFAKVKPKLLLEELNRGTVPDKPDSCPHWLYELMQKCWDRDLTKRPTAVEILSKISERLKTEDVKTRSSIHDTFESADTGSSDSSVTYRKKVYPSCQQPTLPPRGNNSQSARRRDNDYQEYPLRDTPASDKRKSDVKLRKGQNHEENKKKSENLKGNSNKHQGMPITNVRSPSRSGVLNYEQISSDPVYRDSASLSSTYKFLGADSILYKDTVCVSRDVMPVDISHRSDKDNTDMYLTCVDATTDENNADPNMDIDQWVSSVGNKSAREYRNKLSGEIRIYDNVTMFHKCSRSTQQHSTNIDRTVSSESNVRPGCQCEECVECSCRNSSGGNIASETGSVSSCRNSKSETGSDISCGNSETGSMISCGNSETGSVISRGSNRSETGSVISCGNSTSEKSAASLRGN